MAASDVDYLFFHWPYFLNAGVYAAARRLPVYLWLGELPGALRDTVGPTCARSRWRADRGFDGPNSNHYTKVVAAALLLDVGGVPGVLFRAGKGCEIPNFEGSYLGRFPLVLADSWTSDHLSDRSRP